MSAIFGLYARSGTQVNPDDLVVMGRTLPPYLAAGVRCWSDGLTALGKVQGLHTPEDVFDDGIVQFGQFVVAAIATLNNRADLVSALGISGVEAKKTSDARLAGLAWEKWGADCAYRLSGIWAIAVWDRQARNLHIIRDQFSYLELSYHLSDHHFAFGHRPMALLGLPFVSPDIDVDRLVDTLIVIRTDAARSPWRDIKFLPPGHSLKIDANGCRVTRYWRPEDAPDVRFRKDSEYVEALRELLDRSVLGYLRGSGQLGVTLSGGLDSALVTESAARQLKSKGDRIDAFTAIPVFESSPLTRPWQIGDESDLAAEVAQTAGNINHHLLKATDVGLIDGLTRSIAATDSPDYAVGNAFWLWSMLDTCKQRSIPTLLMGTAGNTTVSWDGGSFAGNITSWPPRRDAISRWLTNPSARPIDAWRGLLQAPFIPRRLRAWRNARGTARYTDWQDYSAMNPQWYEQRGVSERINRSGRSVLFERNVFSNPRDELLLTIRTDRRLGLSGWSQLGLESGVQPRDPTADHRIVEFCVGAPSRQFQRDGVTRFMARRLLDGRVTDSVAWNRKRGLQGADLALRIREVSAQFREALADLEGSLLARELLDLPRIGRVLDSVDGPLDPGIALRCELILMRGLGMGLFIRSAGL